MTGTFRSDTVEVEFSGRTAGGTRRSWSGTIRGALVEPARSALAKPLKTRIISKRGRPPTGGSKWSLSVTDVTGCKASGNHEVLSAALTALLAEAGRQASAEGGPPVAAKPGKAVVEVAAPTLYTYVELQCGDGMRARQRLTDGRTYFRAVSKGTECVVWLKGAVPVKSGPVRAPARILCTAQGDAVTCREG